MTDRATYLHSTKNRALAIVAAIEAAGDLHGRLPVVFNGPNPT